MLPLGFTQMKIGSESNLDIVSYLMFVGMQW
jgi:hypothetical protein